MNDGQWNIGEKLLTGEKGGTRRKIGFSTTVSITNQLLHPYNNTLNFSKGFLQHPVLRRK